MSYNEMVADLKNGSKGNGYSKSDLNSLAMAMFNDVDAAIPVYVKKGSSYEEKLMYPGRDLRTQLIAPILKSYGVDKAEIASLDKVQTSRAGGEALANWALLLVKEYISTQRGLGRKLTLPMTSARETVQSISTVGVSEETRKTMEIVKEGETYTPKPTGNITKTAEHEKMRVGNRVPEWLKTTMPDPNFKGKAA